MADKPARGLADVVAASTALSDIDGAVGRLSYRGYDIKELAGRISFEECVHLLLRGTLPTRTELDDLLIDLAAARQPGPTVEAILPYIARWKRSVRWFQRCRLTIPTLLTRLPRPTSARQYG